jgi:predicted enzyme related to lactoylglutathione lyase
MASKLSDAPMSAVLPATDLVRARDFYERVLGLKVEDAIQDAPGAGFFVEAGKGTRTLVYETTASHGEATAAGFVVDDIDAVVADLRSRGVVFQDYDMPMLKTVDGIADLGPMGRAAWFMDSEGNAINVAQM